MEPAFVSLVLDIYLTCDFCALDFGWTYVGLRTVEFTSFDFYLCAHWNGESTHDKCKVSICLAQP